MRRLSVVVLLSASVVGVSGCGDSPRHTPPTGPTTPDATCAFSLVLTESTFNASGGSGSATVTTGPQCRWSPNAGTNSWIKFEATGPFVGPATIALTVEPNRSFSARSALLDVADGNTVAPASTRITQRAAGCLYSVEPRTLTRGWLGTSDGSDVGAFEVRVHAEPSDCRWTATPSVPWMQIPRFSPTSGTGDGAIDIAILWNSSPDTRVGDVVVAGLSGVNPDAQLLVTQTGR